MSGFRPADLLRRLDNPEATDRALLARFVLTQDQAAFAELVRRHAALVLAVCRRVTGHEQDAEDAFQAVFLTLVRKADALANPDLLGNWLYGVSVRVSQTARRSTARRRKREVAINPVRPILAVLEQNAQGTRIGFWDFSTEDAGK